MRRRALPIDRTEGSGLYPLPLRLFFVLLFSSLLSIPAFSRTIYTVVLGNQNYVVGSSTLRSGLFVSHDDAKTWRHVGPENLKAYSMDAVDSAKGRVLYIAAGNGVHKSTDFGATWRIMTDWRMTEVLDVKVDQSNPDDVYAATAFGLWRSTDGGETWSNPDGPLKKRYCYRLMMWNSHVIVEEDRQQKRLWWFVRDGDSLRTVPDPWAEQPEGCRYRIPNYVGRYDTVAVRFGLVPCDLPLDAFALALHGTSLYAAYPDTLWRLHGVGEGTPFTDRLDDYGAPLPTPFASSVHAMVGLTMYGSIEPDDDPLLVGTFGDGLFLFDGKEWTPAGLDGSQVWSIVVKEYDVAVEVGHAH